MKISCEVVNDLLPLYHEDLCSEDSKRIIEGHLTECESCKEIIRKMKNETLDDTLESEKNTILSHSIQKINKIAKFLGIGCTTIITIPIVIGVFMSIFVSEKITISNIVISAIIIAMAYFVGFYFDIPIKFMGEQFGKTKKKSFYIGVWLIILYMIPNIVCFIVNLAYNKTLNWFYLVLASHMVAASLTVVPLIVPIKKFLWTISSFTISLLFLFLVIGLHVGGDWVWITCISTLFGLSVLFLPFVVRQLPIKGTWSQHKGLIIMCINTILLLLLVSSVNKTALEITSICLIFPWVLFLFIRYVNFNKWIKTGFCLFFIGLALELANYYSNVYYGAYDNEIIVVYQSPINWDSAFYAFLCVLGLSCILIGFIKTFTKEIKQWKNVS